MIQENVPWNGKQLHMNFLMAPYFVPYVLLHINSLSEIIWDTRNQVLFADDTSTIITNSVLQVFKKYIKNIIVLLNKWSKSNAFSLNLDRTHFLQF
jgi:hypothetical protein